MDPLTGTVTAAAFGALLFNTIFSKSAERGLYFLINRAAEGVDAVRRRRTFDKAFNDAVSAFRRQRGDEAEAQRLLAILSDEKNKDALEPLALEARKLYLFPLTDRPDPWALVRKVRDVPAFASLVRGEDPLARYFDELFGALHDRLLEENEFFGPAMRACEQLRLGREIEAETRAARQANERAAALLQALLDFWRQERARQEAIPNLAPLRQDYLDFLRRQCVEFDCNSLLPHVLYPVMIGLRLVYVDLRLEPLDRRGTTREPQTEFDVQMILPGASRGKVRAVAEGMVERRFGPVPAREALSERRLAVLGDPGAGKSWLLKRIALDFADGLGAAEYGLPDGLLPVLFSIGAYARDLRENPGEHRTVLDFLPEHFRQLMQRDRARPDLAPLFRHALDNGYALVLMDGLDEVLNADERRAVSGLASAFVDEYARVPGNRFVITSRFAGYDYPLTGGFHRYAVLPLEPADIRRFVELWCPAYQLALPEGALQRRDLPQENIRKLTAAIFDREDVTDLARNPLLITLLALVYYEGRELPERRVDLYKRCIEALIEKWNLVRSLSGQPVGQAGASGWRLSFRDAVAYLGPVANWIRQHNPDAGSIPQDRLVDLFVETLRRRGHSLADAERTAQEDLLPGLRDTAGLLQHKGGEQYGFLHPTFQEYLAARALLSLEKRPEQVVKRHALNPTWREVIRLAVAGSDEERTQEALLEAILAASGKGDRLGRNVVLAGECLLDAGRAPLWDQVRRRLLVTMRDPAIPVETRAEAGTVLGRLGDLRPDVACRLPALVEIPAGPFWMGDDQSGGRDEKPAHTWDLPTCWIGRYPVTNAQFGAFIEAGGYGDDSRWTPEGLEWRDSTEKRWGRTRAEQPEYWDRYGQSRPNHPVVGVTWYEAVAYCNWLTQRLQVPGYKLQVWRNEQLETFNPSGRASGRSLEPGTFVVRLPTEAEWEKAARGGISLPGPNPNPRPKRSYPWGEQFDRLRANTADGGPETTTPVGMYPADGQPYELYDLAGNVWEWCSSAYVSYEASRGGGPAEPDARPEDRRVVRGGSWVLLPVYARCASRSHYTPVTFPDHYGFRVVVGLLTSPRR